MKAALDKAILNKKLDGLPLSNTKSSIKKNSNVISTITIPLSKIIQNQQQQQQQ